MHLTVIARILGIFLMLFSITMLPPILVSMYYDDGATEAFATAMMMIFGIGFASWLPFKGAHQELQTRDGFLVTVLFWFVLTLSGSLPFILAHHPGLSFTDAFFESASGWTTTGSTVIVGLDNLPKSILWYRQQLQWLGGMGLVVLAVAVLPMLGIGGMQLFRAETPGPVKDAKLTPRIAETAKMLWYIYLSLTVLCSLGFWAAGMSLFDAVGHAFATISTGGLSTHDASIGYFDNVWVEIVAIIFMTLGAINFALHFMVLRHKNPGYYWQDAELRLMLVLFVISSLIIAAVLTYLNIHDPLTSYRQALFEVVSIATTTGFGVTDFTTWPVFIPVLILFLGFSSGCAGSTVGGIKLIRVMLIFKQGSREVKRLIHPNGIFPIRIGNRPVDPRVSEAVWGFMSVYVFVYVVIMMILMATGLDMVTAFSAVGACLNNIGPGLGEVAANFGSINDVSKWALSAAMLLGRLEIFTVLVLLSPSFWRN